MSKRCQCVGKKMALLVLRRVGLCVGQNQMCHLCGWLKLFLKNVRSAKIKIQKRWLLGRLSECSLFLSLFSVSLCLSFVLCSFFRLAGNVLQLPEVRIFETVFYRTAYNKAKYLIDICKAKITVFREATNSRQKTYTSARIFFRYCYALAFSIFKLEITTQWSSGSFIVIPFTCQYGFFAVDVITLLLVILSNKLLYSN